MRWFGSFFSGHWRIQSHRPWYIILLEQDAKQSEKKQIVSDECAIVSLLSMFFVYLVIELMLLHGKTSGRREQVKREYAKPNPTKFTYQWWNFLQYWMIYLCFIVFCGRGRENKIESVSVVLIELGMSWIGTIVNIFSEIFKPMLKIMKQNLKKGPQTSTLCSLRSCAFFSILPLCI